MAGSKSTRGGKAWKKQLASMAKAGQIPNAIVGSTEQQAELFKEINKLYPMPDFDKYKMEDSDGRLYIQFLDASQTSWSSYPSGENATQEEKDGVLKWKLYNHLKKK